jgi:hypothetical protein
MAIIVALFVTTATVAWTNDQTSTVVIPVGFNFPVAQNTGQDVIGGKPGIAFDGTNFLVPYFQGTDIFATRVTPQGVVLDSPSIAISVGLNQAVAAPSVEFDGTNYLVVWVAVRSDVTELYGARVTPSGTVLDPGGVQITTVGRPMVRMPGIAFDGANYLVAWRTHSNEIYATRVSQSVMNLDDPAGFQITSIGGAYYPAVAFDGTNYLIVWHDSRNVGTSGWDVYGARVTPQGNVLDSGGFVICDEPLHQEHVSVGFDGINYLVAWYDYRPNNDQIFGSAYGARVTPAGVVLDTPAFQIAKRSRGQYAGPKVVCGGDGCLVVWNTDYPNVGTKFRLSDVWGRRISQAGEILDQQGIPVATAFGHQFGAIAAYGGGRYLVVWSESTARETNGAIYGQVLEQKQVVQSQFGVPKASQVDVNDLTESVWTAENAPIASYATAGLAFSPSNSWAFGDEYAYHYQNGAWQSETIFPPGHEYAAWTSGPDDIWVTGWCAGFSHYNGHTWMHMGCTPGDGWHSATGVWGDNSANLWATKNGGKLTRYDGTNHNGVLLDSGLPFDFSDLWGTSTNNIYAVGERGTILKYNGTTWHQQSGIPTYQRLNAIWGSKSNDIFVVGDWGTILHFNGVAWRVMDSGTLEDLYDIWGLAGSEVYAVGLGGTILHYNGTAWVIENSGTTMDLLSVWGVLGNNIVTVWASGSGNQILKSVKDVTLANRKYVSTDVHDGWVLESTRASGKGGSMNAGATTFYLGDDAQDRQYRALLSFNTGALPEKAVITKAVLKIRKQGLVGTNPFTTHSSLKVDISTLKFGTSPALQASDFQAIANKSQIGTFGKIPVNNWYSSNLGKAAFPYINLTGVTQFRLRFTKDDNGDHGADYMKFFSGNGASAYRPVLEITYYVP